MLTAGKNVLLTTVCSMGAAALVLTGCGSSGGGAPTGGGGGSSDSGGVSTSDIIAKLKTDSTFAGTFAQLDAHPQAANLVYTCVAKALKADTDASSLSDYVNGDASITSLGNKIDQSAFAKDTSDCATTLLKSQVK